MRALPFIVATAVSVALSLSASAAVVIPVANSSFENPVAALPQGWANNAIPNWTKIGSGGDVGVLNETVLSAPEAPDGIQWLYVATGTGGDGKGVWQNIGELDVTLVYTLTLTVAQQSVAEGGNFRAALYTDDGTGTTPTVLLAEKIGPDTLFSSINVPAPMTLIYDAAAHPEYAGRDLYVHLTGASTNSTRMLFDDVSLTAIPEPSALVGLGMGAMGLMARRRRSH